MLCQLRFSDSLNKDYDENIHLPGLWLDTQAKVDKLTADLKAIL